MKKGRGKRDVGRMVQGQTAWLVKPFRDNENAWSSMSQVQFAKAATRLSFLETTGRAVLVFKWEDRGKCYGVGEQ